MTTTLAYTVRGTSELSGGATYLAQLPNGELFALQTQQTSSNAPSKIEFLNPAAGTGTPAFGGHHWLQLI